MGSMGGVLELWFLVQVGNHTPTLVDKLKIKVRQISYVELTHMV